MNTDDLSSGNTYSLLRVTQHITVIAFATMAFSANAQTSGYTLIDLGNLNGTYKSVSATGLNALGQVVGTGILADGHAEAFVTGSGGKGMVSLGLLSGFGNTIGYGINDNGQIVGTASDQPTLPTSGGSTEAFTYDTKTGKMQGLGMLGGTSSQGTAINSSGTVAGTVRNAGNSLRVFTVAGNGAVNTNVGSASGLTGVYNVAGITNDGRIAGNYTLGGQPFLQGFVLNANGTSWTQAAHIHDINNLGQVAVDSYVTITSGSSGQYSTTVLDYSQTAINDKGLVGGIQGNGLSYNPYINVFLKDANGNKILSAWDLGYDKTSSGSPAWSYTGITDINNSGDFVINANNGHAYLAMAVPEPAAFAYMMLGIAGIGLTTRRRKQAYVSTDTFK